MKMPVLLSSNPPLSDDHIFVFGSNLAGVHGAGAALYARKHLGAEMGIGMGMTGKCYALPTKDYAIKPLAFDRVRNGILTFVKFACEHPELNFKVTSIGTGHAGFTIMNMVHAFMYAFNTYRVYDPTSQSYRYPELTSNMWFDTAWKEDFEKMSYRPEIQYWGTFND